MTVSIWWLAGACVVIANLLMLWLAERWFRKLAESELAACTLPPSTIKEYAQRNRIHPTMVGKMIRRGDIHAEKVGRQWRIKQEVGA